MVTTQLPTRLSEDVRFVCPKGVRTFADCDTCEGCEIPRGFLAFLRRKPQREGIHVTDLTGCIRKAYYARTQPEPVMPIWAHTARTLGTIVHDALALYDVNANVPLELDLGSFKVVGTADRVANGVVEEVKTTRWLDPSRLPYGNHLTQIRFYGAILTQLGWTIKGGRIVYVDLTGPSRCKICGKVFGECQHMKRGHSGFAAYAETWTPRMLDETFFELQAAAIKLQEAVVNKQPPIVTPSWECRYCDYERICKTANEPLRDSDYGSGDPVDALVGAHPVLA